MASERLRDRSVFGMFGTRGRLVLASVLVSAAVPGCAVSALGQAITIDTSGNAQPSGIARVDAPVDRRYAQIEPTKVELPTAEINARTHQDILRLLVAEQGFAMRPLPRGKKGLTLAANGKLAPAGERYLNEVIAEGLSVKPGDRAVLTNIRIDKDRIVFDINGGPEHKHNFLRHISIGAGPQMSPVVQDDGQEPSGSRITLTFAGHVPDVTAAQLKALLSPLISFDMKTPVQAFTDTLPPKLKEAILGHHVLVGMSTEMVLYALGAPEAKSREMDGQMPFEEWIYGHPPQDVNFVRVNGNRVIRVEVAKLGQPLEVYTKDEVEGLMTTTGRPVVAEVHDPHTIQLGDVHRDPDTQAPAAPPSLRKDGEKLPQDEPMTEGEAKERAAGRDGAMKPVIFPKDRTKEPANTVPAHPAPAGPPPDPDAPAAVPAGAPGEPVPGPPPARFVARAGVQPAV